MTETTYLQAITTTLADAMRADPRVLVLGEDVAEGARILREAGIPTFAYPDTACILFNHLWRYDANLRSLYETPRLPVAPERGEFREEALRQMTLRYRELMHANEPVHDWPVD